jgi:hypothetical protein
VYVFPKTSGILTLILLQLDLMRALIMWALHESEVISNIIKEAYKGTRQADDLNVPLSVQPWGKDELKRRYWLVEGRDDTDFRLYRENNPALKNGTWRSMAGTIDELREVVEKLDKDKAQASRRLAQRIMMAIPRFEASEEVGTLFCASCIRVLIEYHRNDDDVSTA